MYKTLFALSIIWISIGLFSFPFIFFIGLFAGSVGGLQHLLTEFVLLFYGQLIIQSIIALISLKQIKSLKQYLSAILLILVPFLIFLPIGLTIGMRHSSDIILHATLYGSLLSQLIGSIWIWVLTAKKSKQPLAIQSTSAPTESNTLDDLSRPPMTPEQAPLSSSSQKSHKKLGTVILLTPLFLFVLALPLTAIAIKVNPEYYTHHISTPFPIAQIAAAVGNLSGMLIIPCVIIGAVLLAKR